MDEAKKAGDTKAVSTLERIGRPVDGCYREVFKGMMAQRRISSQELAAQVGITQANLSILKTGKAKAIRFSTLDAICKALDCQPGDILEYREEESQ